MTMIVRPEFTLRFRTNRNPGHVARQKAIAYYTAGPRRAVSEGRISDALSILATRAKGFLSDRHLDLKMAEAVINEATAIFEAANDPKQYQWGLRIAAHCYNVGKTAKAESLFSRIMGYIKSEAGSEKRDRIRYAAAMAYCELGNKNTDWLEKAEKMARDTEDPINRYVIFRDISIAYSTNENLGRHGKYAAVCSLMNNCLRIAVEQKAIRQFVEIAELLVSWEVKEEARKAIRRMDSSLPNSEINMYSRSFQEQVRSLRSSLGV